MRCRSLLLLLLPFAAGCAQGDASFPSLLPRAIEQRSDAVAVAPEPTATPDAALDRSIATIAAQIGEANREFDARADAADAIIRAGAGAATGSDAWVAAQTALAELNAARAATLAPLADLEELAIARARAGQSPYPALETALAEAERVDAAQAQRLAALEAVAG